MTIAKRRAEWVDHLTARFHRVTLQHNLKDIIVATVEIDNDLYVSRDGPNMYTVHRRVKNVWDGSEATAYSLAGLSDALEAMGAAMIPF